MHNLIRLIEWLTDWNTSLNDKYEDLSPRGQYIAILSWLVAVQLLLHGGGTLLSFVGMIVFVGGFLGRGYHLFIGRTPTATDLADLSMTSEADAASKSDVDNNITSPDGM